MENDPDLSHIHSSSYMDVYEPAEDTYLMMDALKEDLKLLQRPEMRFPTCLEIGTGTGVLITYLAKLLGHGVYYATDINPHAAHLARQTLLQNKIVGDVVLTDLVSGLCDRLHQMVDVVIFNPPYVPTPPEEMKGDGISRAWAGGERGREVLDRILPQFKKIVRPSGLVYLVILKANDPKEIVTLMNKEGFDANQILERKAGREQLYIYRFQKQINTTVICQSKKFFPKGIR